MLGCLFNSDYPDPTRYNKERFNVVASQHVTYHMEIARVSSLLVVRHPKAININL